MESSSVTSVAPATPAQWHRRVLTLAFPIVLANLTQPILSAVDTAVAGHLPGPEYIGGVALGGVFFNFVFWGFGFLRMGTTGLVSQAHGAGDARALRASVVRALLLALAIGALLLVLQGPAIRITLTLLGASDTVTRMAEVYCHARIWSAPFALANYVVLGTLLGRQQVRRALLLQVFINAVNMAAWCWGRAWVSVASARRQRWRTSPGLRWACCCCGCSGRWVCPRSRALNCSRATPGAG